MAQVTVNVGDGLGDIGYSYALSWSGSNTIASVYNIPATYVTGSYYANNAASTVRPVVITSLKLRLGGTTNNGATTPTYYYGNADGNLTINGSRYSTISQTSTTQTYSSGTIAHKIDTNTTDVSYGFAGNGGAGSTCVFARSTSGATYLNGSGTASWTGSISGQLAYETIPSKPTTISATNVLQTTLTLNWSAPLDDGVQEPAAYSASNIKGYRIAYKANAATAWSVLVANTGSSSLTRNITGLTPFTKYDFQVSALNSTTDAYSATYTSITATVGERSNVLTLTTLASSPKVWNGSAMTSSTTRVWDGSAWVGANVQVWDGTQWKQLPL